MYILAIAFLMLLIKFLKEWIKHGFQIALKRTVRFFIATIILCAAMIIIMLVLAAA